MFTPAPGDTSARLPVLVWIHGGGFFAGSPSSPWYDGVSYNRDGIVTVSLSYRLGFDGFGWISDAPTNRGLRDMILGLEWVRDNIAAFGGDPSQVTIAGQSAGGSAVMCLLASPLAQPLFARAISHSGGGLTRTIAEAERIGRDMADRAAVPPTRAGWSTLTEDAILDLQTAYMAPTDEPPASAAEWVAVRSATGRWASRSYRSPATTSSRSTWPTPSRPASAPTRTSWPVRSRTSSAWRPWASGGVGRYGSGRGAH